MNPGKRIPIRGKRTGSVRIVTPKKLMSTVECPIQANVNCVSLHCDGSGLAEAGAIGRQLSIVHSRKRCPTQRRTREVRRGGPLDVSIQLKLERAVWILCEAEQVISGSQTIL